MKEGDIIYLEDGIYWNLMLVTAIIGTVVHFCILDSENDSNIGHDFSTSRDIYTSPMTQLPIVHFLVDFKKPVEERLIITSNKCACPMRDLLINGCKCGGI